MVTRIAYWAKRVVQITYWARLYANSAFFSVWNFIQRANICAVILLHVEIVRTGYAVRLIITGTARMRTFGTFATPRVISFCTRLTLSIDELSIRTRKALVDWAGCTVLSKFKSTWHTSFIIQTQCVGGTIYKTSPLVKQVVGNTLLTILRYLITISTI